MGGASLAGVVLGALLGAAVGIGGYTFVYARGYSYLIDDPQACMNCHVMREQFDGWVKSSHRSVATCNSCHTPHRFFAKSFVKAQNPFYRVVELTETTDDPMLWGKNFPLQYDQYLRTIDQVRTKYGGSEALPRTPTQADPRSVVARSRLERDPRLTTIYAGYAFSKDFRERRGHAYMLEDQIFTGRQQAVQQPGTCLHCHGSMVVPYREAGGGDLIKGFETLNPMPYQEAVKHVKYPVACIDCQDPKTMQV